jgi:hypothetical protein
MGARTTIHPWEVIFANAVLAGANSADALRLSRPDVATWKPASVVRVAARVRRGPWVSGYIQTELARVENERRERERVILSRMDKRAFLGRVVRAHDGEQLPKRYLNHDPLIALKLDNEMTGDNAPVRVEGEVTLGLIMAALASTTGLPAPGEMADGEALEVDARPVAALALPAPQKSHANGNGKHSNGANGNARQYAD